MKYLREKKYRTLVYAIAAWILWIIMTMSEYGTNIREILTSSHTFVMGCACLTCTFLGIRRIKDSTDN